MKDPGLRLRGDAFFGTPGGCISIAVSSFLVLHGGFKAKVSRPYFSLGIDGTK